MTHASQSKLLDRIVLGTAQLGLPYGRRRGGQPPSSDSAAAVLDRAWALGVRAFDTAASYGTAADRLSRWLASNHHGAGAHVVTKVGWEPVATLEERARDAVRLFQGCASVTLLAHGFVDQGWPEFAGIARSLSALPGLSVYTSEVRAALSFSGLDRLQAPANIFDRRALDARAAAGSPTPIDVRSVFLQGVLLDEPAHAESRVSGGGKLAMAVREAGAAAMLPTLLAAAVLRDLREGDRIVVGADEPEELAFLQWLPELDAGVVDEFVSRARAGLHNLPDALLDPRQW